MSAVLYTQAYDFWALVCVRVLPYFARSKCTTSSSSSPAKTTCATSSRTSICFVNAGCVLGAHLCVCQTQKPGAARRPDRPGLLLPGGPPGGNPAARPTRQNPDLARQNPDFGPDLRPAFACSETRLIRLLIQTPGPHLALFFPHPWMGSSVDDPGAGGPPPPPDSAPVHPRVPVARGHTCHLPPLA